MSSEIAIKVENLSKAYLIYTHPQDRLKQFLFPRFQSAFRRKKKNYYREFYALQNITFEVKKGETIGIVGRNGSGKSTLLQIICGTLTPTSGTVQLNGRVAALLELGSGFNPEFTGRENVYLNGAILGLSQDEIDARFDDIASFADIGEFIEHPVKTYSSGMIVRLAFAVQAQVDPAILIVDEALAVGDVKFQAKCFKLLKKLKENGTSILLVTHSNEQIVTHCSAAMLLDQGVQLEIGDPKHIVNRYQDLLFGVPKSEARNNLEMRDIPNEIGDTRFVIAKDELKENISYLEDLFSSRIGYNKYEYRWGDGAASILDYQIDADGEPYQSVITIGQKVNLRVSVKFHDNIERPIFGITVKTKEGVTVCGTNTDLHNDVGFQNLGQNKSVVCLEISFICRLAPGDYFISLGVASKQGTVPHDRRYDAIVIMVLSRSNFYGMADLDFQLSPTKVFGSAPPV